VELSWDLGAFCWGFFLDFLLLAFILGVPIMFYVHALAEAFCGLRGRGLGSFGSFGLSNLHLST
jgi:hypothetical protein